MELMADFLSISQKIDVDNLMFVASLLELERPLPQSLTSLDFRFPAAIS
jgi:hypothetical protein